jgi:hypothetical protein
VRERIVAGPVRENHSIVRWTVIATTEERFSDFAPYVPSVNDEDTVAFQAALRGGDTGVFSGDGGAIAEVVGPILLAGVTSHPDLNNSGATSFYGELANGAQGVFLLREGRLLTIASTRDGFDAIGPLGPTMNEAGTVAFRAEPTAGVSGVFAGDGADLVTVADTEGRWSEFHGLPVIDGRDRSRRSRRRETSSKASGPFPRPTSEGPSRSRRRCGPEGRGSSPRRRVKSSRSSTLGMHSSRVGAH